MNIPAYGKVGRPYFRVEDVAEWLGISDVAEMLKCVDEDEKVKMILPPELCTGELQPNIEYQFLTEAGLYEILFQSRSPIAEGFKKGAKRLLHDVRTGRGLVHSWSMDDSIYSLKGMLHHYFGSQQSG
jgi:hypothetical protein